MTEPQAPHGWGTPPRVAPGAEGWNVAPDPTALSALLKGDPTPAGLDVAAQLAEWELNRHLVRDVPAVPDPAWTTAANYAFFDNPDFWTPLSRILPRTGQAGIATATAAAYLRHAYASPAGHGENAVRALRTLAEHRCRTAGTAYTGTGLRTPESPPGTPSPGVGKAETNRWWRPVLAGLAALWTGGWLLPTILTGTAAATLWFMALQPDVGESFGRDHRWPWQGAGDTLQTDVAAAATDGPYAAESVWTPGLVVPSWNFSFGRGSGNTGGTGTGSAGSGRGSTRGGNPSPAGDGSNNQGDDSDNRGLPFWNNLAATVRTGIDQALDNAGQRIRNINVAANQPTPMPPGAAATPPAGAPGDTLAVAPDNGNNGSNGENPNNGGNNGNQGHQGNQGNNGNQGVYRDIGDLPNNFRDAPDNALNDLPYTPPPPGNLPPGSSITPGTRTPHQGPPPDPNAPRGSTPPGKATGYRTPALECPPTIGGSLARTGDRKVVDVYPFLSPGDAGVWSGLAHAVMGGSWSEKQTFESFDRAAVNAAMDACKALEYTSGKHGYPPSQANPSQGWNFWRMNDPVPAFWQEDGNPHYNEFNMGRIMMASQWLDQGNAPLPAAFAPVAGRFPHLNLVRFVAPGGVQTLHLNVFPNCTPSNPGDNSCACNPAVHTCDTLAFYAYTCEGHGCPEIPAYAGADLVLSDEAVDWIENDLGRNWTDARVRYGNGCIEITDWTDTSSTSSGQTGQSKGVGEWVGGPGDPGNWDGTLYVQFPGPNEPVWWVHEGTLTANLRDPRPNSR